ncbi:hypothetical protein LY76DRAFT_592701 [Colletotrichum caudatum]|nr:hypothetical protein LY76DRAFT_592701 [Colletotrichum caudatum]
MHISYGHVIHLRPLPKLATFCKPGTLGSFFTSHTSDLKRTGDLARIGAIYFDHSANDPDNSVAGGRLNVSIRVVAGLWLEAIVMIILLNLLLRS